MIKEFKIACKDFIEILEKYKDNHKELISPTGCGFQDVYVPVKSMWIEPCTPERLYEFIMKYPNERGRLSLVSNHKKWYSWAKLKNLKLRIWVEE